MTAALGRGAAGRRPRGLSPLLDASVPLLHHRSVLAPVALPSPTRRSAASWKPHPQWVCWTTGLVWSQGLCAGSSGPDGAWGPCTGPAGSPPLALLHWLGRASRDDCGGGAELSRCPGPPPGWQGGLPSFSPEPGVLPVLGAGGRWPASVGNWASEAVSDGQWPWRVVLEPGPRAGRPARLSPGSTASSEHKGLRAARVPLCALDMVGAPRVQPQAGELLDGDPAPSARASENSPLGLAPPCPLPTARPWPWGLSARMPTVMVVPVSAKGRGSCGCLEDGGSRMFPEGHGGCLWGWEGSKFRSRWDVSGLQESSLVGAGVLGCWNWGPGRQQHPGRGLPAAPP